MMSRRSCENDSCELIDNRYADGGQCLVSFDQGAVGVENFCPKQQDWNIDQLRKMCGNYQKGNFISDPTPEEIKQGICLAHLADARVHICWIKKSEDLVRDDDYQIECPIGNIVRRLEYLSKQALEKTPTEI